MPDPHFSKDLFAFLRALKRNNNRGWFAEHKDQYIERVRDPMLAFIAAFAPRIEKISPRFVADPSPVGGSMFRIYRDTRFGGDKTPYKTAATAQFRHEQGKDVHAPGFYLHLEPGTVFMAAGIWHPDGPALRAIRERIVEDPAGWKKARAAGTRAPFDLAGESLKRPPRGFDADHPLADDLKRKDHVVVAAFDESDALGAGFLAEFTKRCRAASGYVRWLCGAVGVGF
ncbi:MAG: TIGR02453 family protein [Phycisphaerales bacterium]